MTPLASAPWRKPSRRAHPARSAAVSARSDPARRCRSSSRHSKSLPVGEVAAAPVETRYGFHVVLLDRRIAGREMPFEIVRERIAAWLNEKVRRVAIRQYIAILAGRAEISGIDLDCQRHAARAVGDTSCSSAHLMNHLAFEDDAAAALETLGDIVLFAEVQAMGERYDESPASTSRMPPTGSPPSPATRTGST